MSEPARGRDSHWCFFLAHSGKTLAFTDMLAAQNPAQLASSSSSVVEPIRVLVVDDQAMVRGAIAALLSLEADLEVVGEAGDGAQALELLREHVADVVLMDVEMPRLDGISACAAVRHRYPHTQVLMLTAFGRPGYVQRALDAGASGFMVKDTPADQLSDAVRRVATGMRVIDPQLAVETLSRGTSPLTDREADVLRVAAGGGTVADVAKILGLGAGTVRNHISAAMIKTGARTRSDAARIATESGWL